MPDITGTLISTAVPIVILTIVIIVIAMIAVRRLTGNTAQNRALAATGETAPATIVKVWDTGMRVNDNPRIGILLDVRPATQPAFQAEVKQVVSIVQMPQFQPGIGVEVKYDPNDTKKVMISAITGMAGGAAAGGYVQPTMQAGQAEQMLRQIDANNQAILANGVSAPATVLMYTPMGINVNGHNPAASLMVEVRPNGQPSFQAECKGVIAEQSVAKYQPGSTIYVKYDPNDTTRVSIDHS